MRAVQFLSLVASLALTAAAFCQTPVGSTRDLHKGTAVLRYVGGLKGPFGVMPLAKSGSAALRLTANGKVFEVRLKDVDISLPALLRSRLVRSLSGKTVFLEGSLNKDAGTAYVYFPSREGEWTARYRQPLKQLNLSLIEAGLAVPTARLDQRYAHFYRSALSQAQVERVGQWEAW